MEEEHHYTSASEPERVSPAITRSMALEALKDGPRGTLVIAGCAVGLLFNGAGECPVHEQGAWHSIVNGRRTIYCETRSAPIITQPVPAQTVIALTTGGDRSQRCGEWVDVHGKADRISPDVEIQLFDFSVLNKLSPAAKATSEAIEFIYPRSALEQFVNADITNQHLLDQSVVLVNGLRVALNLQLME